MKQTMKHWGIGLAALLFGLPATAQEFEKNFEDNTLRLDYIMAGTAQESHIYLDEMMKQERWAGRKNRLA